jgi:hypothetical protein
LSDRTNGSGIQQRRRGSSEWQSAYLRAWDHHGGHNIHGRYLRHGQLSTDTKSETLDAIVADLADALTNDFKAPPPDQTNPGVSQDALNAFAGLFIADLPEAVRARLYRHQRLVSALGLKIGNVVTLGTYSFEAEPFWTALALAAAGDPVSVTATNRQFFRATATTDISYELIGTTATLAFSNRDLALLSPDRERRIVFLRNERWIQWTAGSTQSNKIEDLAALSSPTDRLRTVHQLREREPAGRYAQLQQQLASGETFDVDAFLPARADLYAKYLGLELTESGMLDWAGSAMTMLQRVGPAETMTRWAGLPVALSTLLGTRVNVSAALIDEVSDAGFNPQCLSPLRGMKLVEAACHTLLDAATAPAWLLATLSTLLDDWVANAGAFVTLLRWSERGWQRDSAWWALPAPVRLACVWTHADRVLSLLLAKPPLASTVSERFSEFHPSSLAALLPLDLGYDADIASPTRLSDASLLLQGLTAALDTDSHGLLQQHLGEVIARVSLERDGARIPSHAVLADRRSGRNALSSFLSLPLAAVLQDQLPLGVVRPLAPDGKDQLCEQTLLQLASSPTAAEGWLMLHALGLQWLPTAAIDRVGKALRLYRFPEGAADDSAIAVCDLLADILPYMPNVFHSAIEQELISWAKRLATAYRSPVADVADSTAASRDPGRVIELGVSLARKETLPASLIELMRVVEALVTAWPGLAEPLRGLVARAIRDCPDQRGLLWQSFVRLRALA